MKNGKRPPIGIEPEYIWKGKRLEALNGAITRYFNEGLPVSEEWVRERNSLIAQGFSPIYEEEVSSQQVQETANEASQLPESTQDLNKPAWYGIFQTEEGRHILAAADILAPTSWRIICRILAEPTEEELTGFKADAAASAVSKGDVVVDQNGNKVKVIEVELLN